MDYILRLPVFPVIFDSGDSLVLARSRTQLDAKLVKLMDSDNAKPDIIDAHADAFFFYREKLWVMPYIGGRRWTKMQIIQLYNCRRKPDMPELRSTSLGSRSLEKVVSEAVELLARVRS